MAILKMNPWRLTVYLCVISAIAPSCAAPTTGKISSQWTSWIDRPWDLRYFVRVEDAESWSFRKSLVVEHNAQVGQRLFNWEEFFEPAYWVGIKPELGFGKQSLAVALVEFDRDGVVVGANSHKGKLRGRLNALQRIGLSEGDGKSQRYFDMGHWFTGLGDESTHWAPGVCSGDQMPDAANIRSDSYLYGKLFKVDGVTPLFGCREWAYQLYDPDRPYIDVTSYEVDKKGSAAKNSIRGFIGWARFGDKKPVIGQQFGEWYCLLDCPGGDRPGVIPDIKKWSARFGWNVPLPPTRVPTFPDPPSRSGSYPKE